MIEECVVRNLHSHRRYNSAPLKKMALNPQLLPSGTTVLMEYEVFGLHQDGALFLVDNIPGEDGPHADQVKAVQTSV
ncbi:hypothetical protein HPP92_011377, partial [Vanilla planifolia]